MNIRPARGAKPAFYLLLVLLLLSIFIGILARRPEPVRAHAGYERSEPPADAIILESPPEVHVWFTQELFRREGANALEVFDPDGVQVDKGDARLDDDDRRHMFVSLPEGLPAATYTVRWRNLSAEDGDTDSGEFSFTVDPAAAQATSQPTPTATAAPTSPPTPTPAPGPSSKPGGGLPCFGGLLSASGLTVLRLRRRNRGSA